jgi:hypothetical protein
MSKIRNLPGSLGAMVLPRISDLGTSFLAIAAILFSNAYPEAATVSDLNLWTLISSAVFFTLGLLLRTLRDSRA